MLSLRTMIPPVTAHAADGRTVRAWDWKQKRSLAIAFLHAECAVCETWLAQISAQASALDEAEAVALIVLPSNVSQNMSRYARAEIIVAADISGRSQRAYLGEDAFGTAGLAQVGVFVSDRYGELRAQWITGNAKHDLPDVKEVLGWLNQVLIACEECGAPHWPSE